MFSSCHPENAGRFRLVPSAESGIDFTYAIIETDSFNILTEEFIYNGAGVGMADFNRDGLPDLFFAGNEVDNHLVQRGDPIS
ncbi:hypothetical protein [Cyclobacterium jeungdonense]|uniref:VCBS repeat-containing protein n=1 Tax=Cyclobacterium jeungdonense TaxID=708087 RepID=A0ABT8C931_9BACT|nr:hypothetical protein [Cyclobacterium jeungdonense]MDN3688642.1 hypothetical protein [Cyclobacterium jeungdonense]